MHAKCKLLAAASALSVVLGACSEAPTAPEGSAQEQFFYNLSQLCGQAFRGTRVIERPQNELLEGDESLVVHFRECNDEQIFAAFHIEQPAEESWDRSRTWVFSLHGDQLELRHDHREEDGSESDNTMYGGFTETGEGTARRQEFVFTERTGPNDEVLGWRVIIDPGVQYSYGTFSDDDWTWRVDFDLSEEVDAPPAAWGHEDGYAQ